MGEDTGERINAKRVEDVAGTNAGTVATACPFCLIMMEDGIKLKDKTEEIKTRDIAELVLEAVQT
jgi:Fe-S oxidoreductase